MAKKTRAQIHADDVEARSEVAGYEVKDHGHRFFRKRLATNPLTGEMYMPVGFKFVEWLWIDAADDNYVWAILKDEHLG